MGGNQHPVNTYLDFNAVIVNLPKLSKSKQKECLEDVEQNIREMEAGLQENLQIKKDEPQTSMIGFIVLNQQLALAKALEKWIKGVDRDIAK